jgi:cytochrome c-type biogenesis protein CcmH/NrfG
MSGLFGAIGVLLLLSALGFAIGITALGDPRAATGDTASGLGIGAGVWTFITLLVAFFLAGMISTQVTDRPDRNGAIIHGILVWVLFMLCLLWLMVSGVSLGLTGLFGAVQSLAQGATAVGISTGAAGGDLTQRLGLDDPTQVSAKLDDPRTAETLAAATGMSNEEARAALQDLRSRVETVQNDPARVAAEVRSFVGQYAERVKQQAMMAAVKAQRGAAIGSWVTFGVMVVTLVVAIGGAMSGVPSLQRWRQAFVRLRS